MSKLKKIFGLLCLYLGAMIVLTAQTIDVFPSVELFNGKRVQRSSFELPRVGSDSLASYFITSMIPLSATSISAHQLWKGAGNPFNLDGQDIPIVVIDAGGIRTTHQEFQGRVVQKDGNANFNLHPSLVTSVLLGAGVDPRSKGIAFNASAAIYDWNDFLGELEAEGQAGALIANMSFGIATGWLRLNEQWLWWGDEGISPVEDSQFGFYSTIARRVDQLATRHPDLLMVVAAGNDRLDRGPQPGERHLVYRNNEWLWSTMDRQPDGPFDCLSHHALSKNVLTVAAVYGLEEYRIPTDVVMTSFSAFGATDDGRIKPEVSANGIGIYAAAPYANSAYNSSVSGSSFAAPAVSGLSALLQQLYQNQFGRPMRAATLKGLIVHTVNETGDFVGPDFKFGYGLVNGLRAAELIAFDSLAKDTIIEAELLNTQLYEQLVFSDGNQPLTATLSWTDPPGLSPALSLNPEDLSLINDLDIRLMHLESGEVYYPYILDHKNPSIQATQGDNFRDNLEKLYLDAPTPGTYRLTIGHKNRLLGASQAFSLIVSGAEVNNDCGTIASFNTPNEKICRDQEVTFINESAAADTYQWIIDGVVVGISKELIYSFPEVGDHEVLLLAGKGNCFSAVSHVVTVSPPADAQYRYTTQGLDVSFQAFVDNPSFTYSWSFGDGTSSEQSNPAHSFAIEGVYQICLTVDDSCPNRYCQMITVIPSGECRRALDSLVIIELHELLGGAASGLEYWGSTMPLESWEGIDLDHTGCRVKKIEIKKP